nr:hypothetical protein [Saprospiraceae bacterium]
MAKQQHKLAIQSYGAYALEASVYVRGRILRAERTAESYRFWATFRSNMRRFVSREVSGVPIMLTLGNRKWETHSDREGYYHFEVESSRNGTASPQAFVLDLLEHVADSHQAYIMDLNPRAQVGVISD